jgi:hypothetical protein
MKGVGRAEQLWPREAKQATHRSTSRTTLTATTRSAGPSSLHAYTLPKVPTPSSDITMSGANGGEVCAGVGGGRVHMRQACDDSCTLEKTLAPTPALPVVTRTGGTARPMTEHGAALVGCTREESPTRRTGGCVLGPRPLVGPHPSHGTLPTLSTPLPCWAGPTHICLRGSPLASPPGGQRCRLGSRRWSPSRAWVTTCVAGV